MIEEKNLELLREYFRNRKDIAFAFLFGSQAKGTTHNLSDVDIAVYFYPEERHPIEYEKDIFYEAEDKIWSDIEKILKKEVELIVMNRASASISASAIRGTPLAINDRGLYIKFMEVITSEAIDFREMLFKNFLERGKK